MMRDQPEVFDADNEDHMYALATCCDPPGIVRGWRGLRGQYIFLSNSSAQMVGFKDAAAVVGASLTDEDLRCEAAALMPQYLAEDQKVIQSKKTLHALTYIRCVDDNWHVLLGQKFPVYDAQGQLQAIGISYQDMSDADIAMLNFNALVAQPQSIIGHDVGQFSCLLGDMLDGVSLTDRQKAVIFYLLRGHSAKSIAARLCISHRTAQDHVRELCVKFGCPNRAALHEQLIHLGYIQLVPYPCLSGLLRAA